MRSRIIERIRAFFTARDFLEVETPMMQPLPGGAAARPFVTHHNALDMDLYLRIAPELYLKRLLVGGFERVFEINRNFRNEGISAATIPSSRCSSSTRRTPTYEDLMELTEELFATLGGRAAGTADAAVRRVDDRPARRRGGACRFPSTSRSVPAWRSTPCSTWTSTTLQARRGQARADARRRLRGALRPRRRRLSARPTSSRPSPRPSSSSRPSCIEYPAAVSPLARRNARATRSSSTASSSSSPAARWATPSPS